MLLLGPLLAPIKEEEREVLVDTTGSGVGVLDATIDAGLC